jgi:tetratricopeptide (TPR) repeat protein
LPIFFVYAFTSFNHPIFLRLLLAAIVIQPLILLLHELGHFLTAQLVGLDPQLITLGVGPNLWTGTILSVPITVRAWPLLGLTAFDSKNLHGLRLRVWITVFMGPATNALLIVFAVVLWRPIVRLVGLDVVILWIVYNALLILGNLWLHRPKQAGQRYRSDGLQLVQIPFRKTADLAIYLSGGSIVSALALFSDGEFGAARDIAVRGLARNPNNVSLRLILSACQISLGDYHSAEVTLEPLLISSTIESPEVRAAIANNLALAVWLGHIGTANEAESTAHAEVLSASSFSQYPCILDYRSTRSLVLTASGRPQEALDLLEYTNYSRGTPSERSDREFARAFALRQLNRSEEAKTALNAGLRLKKTQLPILRTIGLLL